MSRLAVARKLKLKRLSAVLSRVKCGRGEEEAGTKERTPSGSNPVSSFRAWCLIQGDGI